MNRVAYSLGLLLLGACLILNVVKVQEALAVRFPLDKKIGSRKGSIARRAELYGFGSAAMISDLERVIDELREQGHERVVLSYSGKFSNVLASTAIHTAWPMQVLEQETPNLKRNARLLKAAEVDASMLVSLRPGQGWVATRVDSAVKRTRPGADD